MEWKVMFCSWDGWLLIFRTIPSTSKLVTSWWVLAHELECISFLNHKSLYMKHGQLIDIVMSNDLKEPSRQNHAKMFLMILPIRFFFIYITYSNWSKPTIKSFDILLFWKNFTLLRRLKLLNIINWKLTSPVFGYFVKIIKEPGTSFQSSR